MARAKGGIKDPLKTVLLVLAVALLALGGRWLMLQGTAGGETAGKASVGGPFTLTASDGRTVTEKDFRGKYMLLYFGYTFCPDVCPTSLQTMAQALNALPAETMDKIRPVFVSVDPRRDSPAAIGDYVKHFHPSMIGLTGTEAQVKAMAAAWKVYYRKVDAESGDPDAYVMDHSAIVYLMGPDGALITHFPHDASSEAMASKLVDVVK